MPHDSVHMFVVYIRQKALSCSYQTQNLHAFRIVLDQALQRIVSAVWELIA